MRNLPKKLSTVAAALLLGVTLAGTTAATSPAVAAVTPASVHTVDFAVITDTTGKTAPATDAQLRALVTKVSEYYSSQTSGAISAFSVGTIARYKTAITDACNMPYLTTEGAVKVGKTISAYTAANTGRHIVVVTPCTSSAPRGTMGMGIQSGGQVIAGLKDITTNPGHSLTVLAHELGHNLGMMHANSFSCAAPIVDAPWVGPATRPTLGNGCVEDEYHDRYDVMGTGGTLTGTSPLPAMSISYKDMLGVAGGLLTPVTKSGTFTINAASATSGIRGLKITDPRTNEVYWVEYRNAAGRDTYADYTQLTGKGVGFRILKQKPITFSKTSENIGYWSSPKLWWGSYPSGGTFTSHSGGVKVSGTFNGTTAKLTVTVTPTLLNFAGTAAPTISGKAAVGQKLTAVAGAGWAPAPDTSSYQWSRDGQAIAGAVAATYTVTTADRAHNLTVDVTRVKAGYNPVKVRSTAVRPG